MSSNEKEAVATSATTPSDVDAEFYQERLFSVVQLEIQKRNTMRVKSSLHIQL